MEILQQIGIVAAFVLAGLLCLAGIIMSCFTLSGTWVVVIATVIVALLTGSDFPAWWTVIFFLLVSGIVEAIEAVAGALGVKRRGGSWLAGFAAVVGGIVVGLSLGSLLPVIGHIGGVLAGGFLFAFGVEWYRLKKADSAAQIAVGAVLARLFAMLLKVWASVTMTIILAVGLVISLSS